MTWTVHAAAAEWGIDRKTLRRRLGEAGLDLKRHEQFHTKDICRAIYGDAKLEKMRGERLDNELKEIELAEKRGLMVELPQVQRMIAESLQPVRDWMNSLAAAIAHRCNPTDPVLARTAIEESVREGLPLMRDQMPKPK